ncbi:MAG: family 43 glycosylhydrolase, partial [Lachnospiraceae bacterium]
FSWRQGLDRLLLNLALDPSATTSSGDGNANWQGLVPVPFAASEEHLHVLESLLKFIEALFHYSNEATAVRPNGRTAAEWQELLLSMRSDFFLPDKNSAADYAALGQAFQNFKESVEAAGCQELPIPYTVVRALLAATLERPAPGEAFLNGKITFCSLLPMRGIPCKVIALLGMDEAKFPRQDEKLGFNLMRNANLISGYSHSRSMEDRYTFLEAILAARDYLMVFYHGRDDKSLDNLLPAAPVAELLDYAARLRKLSTDGDSNKNLIVIEHRLNAFDAKNFRPQGRQSSAGWLRSAFSYDSTNAAIVMQPQAAVQPSPLTDLGKGLFQLPLPSPLPFQPIGGELYILFAVSGHIWGPQCHLMKKKPGGRIIDEDGWEEPVRVVRKDGTPLAEGPITLDMTFLRARSGSYVIWSYREHIGTPEDSGSMLYIASVDEREPWRLTSDPVLLTRPLFGWENTEGTINNEGPHAFVKDGKVLVTYSGGSANRYTYALGLLTADTESDLLNLRSWTKSVTPVLTFYSVEGEYGPGHNSFFVNEEGECMIAYHAETG